MNSVFITGIPTAGKSFLAKKIADTLGISWMNMDDLRVEMAKDPHLEPWVNFFWRKDEAAYFSETSPDEQWRNLVQQSEAFWPTQKEKIEAVLKTHKPTIFEGVNLLPHLMKETPLPGVVLLGDSEERIIERLRAEPRWGNSEKLHRLEAHAFFTIEGPRYAAEAKKYGYPAFNNAFQAETETLRLIG